MLSTDHLWNVVLVEGFEGQLARRVSEFLDEYFPGTYGPNCTAEEFEWKLGESNPAGRGAMIVALCHETIVGVITSTRKKVLIDGEAFPSAELGDTYTHPSFRKDGGCRDLYPGTSTHDEYLNKSVFGRLANELFSYLESEGLDFVYGTPGRTTVRDVWCRQPRCVEIPGLGIGTWHRPSLAVLQRKVPLGFGRITHIALNVLLNTKRWHKGHNIEAERGPLNPSTPESVYSAIDDLWASQRSRNGIALVQDREFFHHRYALHPSKSYEWHLIRKDGLMAGFVVTRSLVSDSGNIIVSISDWLLREGEASSTLEWLIAKIATTLRPEESLDLWTDSSVLSKGALWRMGLFCNGSIFVIAATINRGLTIGGKQHTWDLRTGWTDNV